VPRSHRTGVEKGLNLRGAEASSRITGSVSSTRGSGHREEEAEDLAAKVAKAREVRS
jgi:hypothetical protein